MDFRKITLKELHEKLVNKEIKLTELVSSIIENCKKNINSNFLITLCEKEAMDKAKELENNIDPSNVFSGIPFIHKDHISTKGILTTAGSKMLSNYIPSYDATIAKKFKKLDTIMIGKAALDELSMGGTGLYSFNGEVRNPYDLTRIVGGSSGGCAYAMAKGLIPFSTGGDTGDSIRKPASLSGCVGFKPTYGAISKYGVVPFAPSLDHVGFFTHNVEDQAYLCDAICEKDCKDFTSIGIECNFVKNINNIDKKIKFGYIKHAHECLRDNLKKDYEKLYDLIRKEGHEVVGVDFDKKLLDAVPGTYMAISYAEGLSTHACLDGIKFGKREEGKDFKEIIKNSRTKNFGEIVKRRFLIGCISLRNDFKDTLFSQAKKVRRLIVEEIHKVYEQVDILILPPTHCPAPTADEFHGKKPKQYVVDSFMDDILILANYSGMPSITIPFVHECNMPIGINLNAKPKEDLKVLQAAKFVEGIILKNFEQAGIINE